MGSLSQLKPTVFDAVDQFRMRSLHPRDDNGDVRHLEQWQIIGRVPESQHLNIATLLLLLQCFESTALADALTEEVGHAVPLDDRQSILLNHRDQPVSA